MRREIKFRGLKVNGNGWVYGYYFGGYGWADFIIEDAGFEHRVQVIPESVGQFTGLTDKNGKEIYEGDVVKGVLYTTGIELDINKDVRFSGGVFTVEKVYIDKIAKIEIIGNIHEKQGGTN